MPAIAAQNLKKSFGPQVVLDGVSLSIARGEKVGLIGANGAGKSTLAKILAGEETTDEGTVAVRRGLTVLYLAQEPKLEAHKSAREVVEDALQAWRKATARHAELSAKISAGNHDDALLHEQAALDEEIHRLGGWDRGHVALDYLHRLGVADVERAIEGRSGGELRRIALARILVARPDVAILDEPTNHLDADTAEWLEEHLAYDFPGAVVLVTHDRYFLDAIATRILEVDRGVVTAYDGGYGDYLDKKEELLAHEDRVERNRQNVLRREREWLSRGPKARTTKQKARIQRANALESETAANAGRGREVQLSANAARHGKTILECRGVVIDIPNSPGKRLVEAFDLYLSPGDRVGIVGPNGVGKTTFLRTALGTIPPAAGEVVMGKNTKVAYLDQARAGLDGSKSIFDDVKGETGSTVVAVGKETIDLRTYLELFLFDASKQRQKVGALSGGERARVALAKTLRAGANLLVFDEPTNDLDLPTLGALEEMLISFEGCVLVVTHDRAFLDRVATSVLAFERGPRGATVERHGGGWSDYVAHKKERAAARALAESAEVIAKKEASAAAAKEKSKGLTWAERKELETILDRIAEAEEEARAIEGKLADPALYASRGDEVPKLNAALAAAKEKASTLVARWESLEAKAAATG